MREAVYLEPVDGERMRRYARRYARRHPLRYRGLLVYVLTHSTGRDGTLCHDRKVFDRGVYLAGLIEDAGLERIHVPWATTASIVATVASRLLRIPYSVQARAYDIHAPEHDYGLSERLKHADLVITNSRYNLAHLRAVVPALSSSGLHRVYNGVDPARFRSELKDSGSAGPARILFVGRLVEQKGIEYLLKACAFLRGDGREFVCDLVGPRGGSSDTNYYVAMRRLWRALELEESVRFRGGLPHDEVQGEYRRADLVVLPAIVSETGRRDITPNVLLEAAAMRLPVVSTRVAGIPELVEHDVTGLLVAPRDEVALAAAIARVFDDPLLARRLGEQGRSRVEAHFDSRQNARRLAELIAPGAALASIASSSSSDRPSSFLDSK